MPIDYNSLPLEDLQALKKGDYNSVSMNTLLALKGADSANKVAPNSLAVDPMKPTEAEAAKTEQARQKFVSDTGTLTQRAKEYIPSRKTIADFARPVLEGGGAVLGGMAGIPAAPETLGLSSVAGAGLGYSGGARLADFLEGKQRTLPDAAMQSLNDIGTGASMEMGGQAAGKVLSTLSAPIINRASPYVQKGITAARNLGITTTPAEVTGSKPLSLAESVLGKLPGSAGIMQDVQQGQQASLQAAKQGIADNLGTTTDTLEGIGSTVKEGLAGKSQAFSAKATELYDKAKSFIPQGTTIPTSNLSDRASQLLGQISKMPESVQNKDLIKVLDDIATNTESLTYDGMQGLRSELKSRIDANDIASKTGSAVKGMGNTEAGAYKFLKGGLEQDLQQFADSTGGQFKDAFDIANGFYRNGKQIFNSPIIKRVMKANPEVVTDMVFRPNAATDVKLLRQAVGTDAFQTAKEAFTTKLLTDEQNGAFSVAKFANRLSKFDDSTLNAIYRPEELAQLQQLAATKPVVRGAEQVAGNASGTAQNMLSYAQMGTAGGLVISGIMSGDPKKIAEGAAVMLAPAGIAKLYLSPLGRKFLTAGFKIPATTRQASELATKLIAIAGVENLKHDSNQPPVNDPLGIRNGQ